MSRVSMTGNNATYEVFGLSDAQSAQVNSGYEFVQEDMQIIGEDDRRTDTENRMITRALVRIRSGRTTYDIYQLRDFLAETRDEVSAPAAIILLDEIGLDSARLLENKLISFQRLEDWKLINKVAPEEFVAMVLYNDQFRTVPTRASSADAVRLFEAGVNPRKAASLIQKGMSVEAVIESSDAAISTAVAEGWL